MKATIKWKRGIDKLTFDRPNVWFNLGKRGSGKSELLEAIGEGYLEKGNGVLDLFGCYDSQTEVLTKEGFKTFSEITLLDEIATLTTEGYLEYAKPTKIHKYPYSGDLISIKGKCDFLVTPNHRMLVDYYGKRMFIEAQEILAFTKTHTSHHTPFRISKSAKWNCTCVESVPLAKPRYSRFPTSIKIEQFMPLLGWYLAEGSVRTGGETPGVGFALNPHNQEEINEVATVIRNSGFKPHICKSGLVVAHSKQLYDLFKPLGQSHTKYIPAWIKDLPPEMLKLLISALVAGDGHVYNERLRIFSTVSKKLADDLQEIAIKSGFASTVFTKGEHTAFLKGRKITASESYDVTIHKETTPSIKRDKVTMQHYEGLVYCVSVPPNETVLVRRNGKAAWSGNSRDGEALAWLRSPWTETKKILLLKGENVDVDCSFDVKCAEAMTLADLENYDIVISPSPLYINMEQEFSDAAKIEDLLYKRLHYNKLIYLCCREASNFYYSRLKICDNQTQAKAQMVYLIRESRHMGVSLGLDSIRSYAIDIDIRSLSDYLLLKAQGVQGLSKDLKWLYRFIDPGLLRNMPPERFIVVTKSGAIGYGTFAEVLWHKQEREDILKEVGIKVEYGEMLKEAQLKGSYKTVGDREHADIIKMYTEDHLSMVDIAEKIKRSSRTILLHVDEHNRSVRSIGSCPKCKRAQVEHADKITA